MSKLAGLSKGFLKWAVMAYISAFAALFIAQRPLVFGHYAFLQPAKPAWDAKLPGEKVALKTADGETLDAWYIPPAHSGRATIVYFHGKSASIAHKQQRMAELTRDGLGLFAVDYRGFGASTGSPSQEGLSADADAAYKWMTKRTGAEKLVVFGESLGSGVAVDLAARVPVGVFTAETFLIRDGKVLGAAVREIDVRKSGFERFVARAAERNSFLYGLTVVALSVLLGWSAGAIARKV